MNRPQTSLFLLFFLSFALCTGPVFAGPLATDGTSYLGIWHGSSHYVGPPLSGLEGDLDWAVYAPGVTPAGFAGAPDPNTSVIFTPTPGEYLYTYQAHETGAASLSVVRVILENFAHNIGIFTATGVNGQSPFDNFIIPFDSAEWDFDGVVTGDFTIGLAFSAPTVPEFTEAVLVDGGTSVSVPAPSPGAPNIPEPSTLTLALCGLVGITFGLLRRRGRRLSL